MGHSSSEPVGRRTPSRTGRRRARATLRPAQRSMLPCSLARRKVTVKVAVTVAIPETLDYTLYDSDSLNISERARWVACLLGRTRGHGRQDIIPGGQGINNNTFDIGDGDVPAAWPPGRSGRNKGIVSFFFSRSARHVLVEEGTRSYLTLPTISHSLLNVTTISLIEQYLNFQHFIFTSMTRSLGRTWSEWFSLYSLIL